LVEGNQGLVNGKAEVYGQSITDACIGWNDTELLLKQLNDAVTNRRNINR
jgi:3-deoxy-7-phosphoheptulonate synthase